MFVKKLNKKNTMDKKGQLYIFVAIIVCSVLVSVFSTASFVKYDAKTIQLDQLCSHFESESHELINALISNNDFVSSKYDMFAKNYYSYTRTINKDFGIFYVFTYKNTTHVGNMLDSSINVTSDSKTYELLTYLKQTQVKPFDAYFDKSTTVTFMYYNHNYTYHMTKDVQLDVMCVYKKSNGDLTIVT
jgi:hypothetical protein